jgi:hypothetical protein
MADTSPKNQDALTAGHTPSRPTRVAKPRELVFEFVRGDHVRWRCELLDHGQYGCEAQILRDEEFSYSQTFPSRPLAVHWAERERVAIESYRAAE